LLNRCIRKRGQGLLGFSHPSLTAPVYRHRLRNRLDFDAPIAPLHIQHSACTKFCGAPDFAGDNQAARSINGGLHGAYPTLIYAMTPFTPSS
jgi:hypothetical protein